MAWDKAKPAGTDSFAVSDDNLRANNDALETAIDAEHRFATGSNQSGRHTFERDTTTNLGAVANTAEGWFGISTDERSGFEVLMVHDGSSIVAADVEPVDGSGDPTLPRVNAKSKFTTCQFAEWKEVTPGAGTPNTLAVNLNESPLKYATITADTEIQNPGGTGIPGHGTVVTLDLLMSGGAHTITFASAYRAVGGIVAIGGNGTRTRLTIEVMQTGAVLVTSLPDWNNTIP